MTTNTQEKWQQFEALKQIQDKFKYKVAENLLKNELRNSSNGYTFDFAGNGNRSIGSSGYSFGGNQMDTGYNVTTGRYNNQESQNLLKNILDQEYGSSYFNSIKGNLNTKTVTEFVNGKQVSST